jgi:hypothetical protein
MTRALRVAAPLLVAACVDGGNGNDDTGDTASDGCPEGLHAADNPDIVFWTFRINGLLRSPVFDDAEYQGRPAGCISDDGKSVDYLFLLVSEPYGRIAMSAPRGDETYGLNEDEATVVIELFGETDQPSFENGEWVNGTWFVSSVGNTFDSDLNGTALDDDAGVSASMAVNFTIVGER